jgi:hypothetical protein
MTDLMIYLHLKIQIRGKTILSCLNKRAVVWNHREGILFTERDVVESRFLRRASHFFLNIPDYAGLRYETSADRWISHLKCLFIGDFPLLYLIPGRQFSQNVGISMFCRLWKPSLHVGEKLELAIRFCHLQFDHHLHHLQKCSHVGDQLLWVPTKTSTMSFTQEFTCKWSTSI